MRLQRHNVPTAVSLPATTVMLCVGARGAPDPTGSPDGGAANLRCNYSHYGGKPYLALFTYRRVYRTRLIQHYIDHMAFNGQDRS